MKRKSTFKEIVRLWKTDKRQYVKKSTFAAYCLHLDNHLIPDFGNRTTIDEDSVQKFVIRKLDSGLSQKYVKDMLVVMRMVLSFGDRLGMTDYKRIQVRFPTERKTEGIEVLSKKEQKKIIHYIKGNFSFRNLGILLCLSAGLRIGEVCALTWDDIDISTGMINVTKTIQRIYIHEEGRGHTELHIGSAKSVHSMRKIPMANEIMHIIRPLKRIVNGSYYILSNNAKPIEPRAYRNYYQKLMKEIGIPRLKFHGLRHSFATRCIESKCDYKTVSVLLGHSNISTTLNLYVHPNVEQKQKCVEQMFKTLR